MSDKLTASEAVFGFVAWLTSQKEVTKMGSNEDCAPLVPLIEKFCEVNSLEYVREDWTKNLMHPASDECSGPSTDIDPEELEPRKMSEGDTEVYKAMQILKDAFRDDPDFAHGWHCNIAGCVYDELIKTDDEYRYKLANDAASRFMKMAFGVETKG